MDLRPDFRVDFQECEVDLPPHNILNWPPAFVETGGVSFFHVEAGLEAAEGSIDNTLDG